MVIRSTSVTKPYVKDFINVSVAKNKLIANPKRRIVNHFIILPCYLAIAGLFDIFALAYARMFDSTTFWVLFAMLLVVLTLCAARYVSFLKALRRSMKEDRDVTYTLTPETFEYKYADDKKIEVPWRSLRCVRFCRNGAFLIPKDPTGILFGLQLDDYEQLKKFIDENNITLEEIK